MESVLDRLLRHKRDLDTFIGSDTTREHLRARWRSGLTQRALGALEALESLTPSPRPASELTPERALVWPAWFLIEKPHPSREAFGQACIVSVESDEQGEYVADHFGNDLDDAFIGFVYPIRPDIALGPIPATWDELDAAVAARKAGG